MPSVTCTECRTEVFQKDRFRRSRGERRRQPTIAFSLAERETNLDAALEPVEAEALPRHPWEKDGMRAYFFAGAFFSFAARIFSIASMVAFISAIAEAKGAGVSMSTPASLRSSTGYFEPPALSMRR